MKKQRSKTRTYCYLIHLYSTRHYNLSVGKKRDISLRRKKEFRIAIAKYTNHFQVLTARSLRDKRIEKKSSQRDERNTL